MSARAFTICQAPQRSEEWYQARCGRLTGSRAADMLARIQKGEAAARREYRTQLVVERLTNLPQEQHRPSVAMQWGIDCEPLALATYEALTGHIAERSGFLAHATHLAGCSLDGAIDGFSGILELKAPNSTTQYRYFRDGGLPLEYAPQVVHNLWISGAAWCDFLSFDPRMPPRLQAFLVRHERNEGEIETYERSALAFLKEVERDVSIARGWSVFDHLSEAQRERAAMLAGAPQ